MELYHRLYGDGPSLPARPPLIILHGLFGAGGNWHTLSRRRFGRHFSTYVVDLRNHGESPHDDVFTYDVMADDVASMIGALNVGPAHVLGHSMGGKVAMFLAMRRPELVDRLVVADMSPAASPGGHEHIISALEGVDFDRVSSRGDAEAFLARTIQSGPIRQFLLKNLTRNADGRYEWKMNLDVISRDYRNILVPVPVGTFSGPTLFVRGSESGYIGPGDIDEIMDRFPNARIEDIRGAGHWVHAEQPESFATAVEKFLLQR